jgi:hypothetical protein
MERQALVAIAAAFSSPLLLLLLLLLFNGKVFLMVVNK